MEPSVLGKPFVMVVAQVGDPLDPAHFVRAHSIEVSLTSGKQVGEGLDKEARGQFPHHLTHY